jgi:hypothetical protein
MPKTNRSGLIQIAEIVLLAIGILLVTLSFVGDSAFLVIFGVALIFWSLILFYITPSRHVPLSMLTASACANANNIERIIAEFDLENKGFYLPPQSLKDTQSGTVFIPKGQAILPAIEEITEKLVSNQKNGVFITPPGLALTQQFEKELGLSFTKMNLGQVQKIFSKLIVEKMDLADEAEMQVQDDLVTVMVKGSVLNEDCNENKSQLRTHELVGCLLSSGVACMLARASGKAVTIKSETHGLTSERITIVFQLFKV